MLLYEDDILLLCLDIKMLKKLKSNLNKEFDMKDLEKALKILGMKITRKEKKNLHKSVKMHTENAKNL